MLHCRLQYLFSLTARQAKPFTVALLSTTKQLDLIQDEDQAVVQAQMSLASLAIRPAVQLHAVELHCTADRGWRAAVLGAKAAVVQMAAKLARLVLRVPPPPADAQLHAAADENILGKEQAKAAI